MAAHLAELLAGKRKHDGDVGGLSLRQDGRQEVVQAALSLDVLDVGGNHHCACLAQPHGLCHLPAHANNLVERGLHVHVQYA